MTTQTSSEDRDWLRRNWTPDARSFSAWIAGSSRAQALVQRVLDDLDARDAEVRRLLGAVDFTLEYHGHKDCAGCTETKYRVGLLPNPKIAEFYADGAFYVNDGNIHPAEVALIAAVAAREHTRNHIVVFYVDCIRALRRGERIDWERVNGAILARWTRAGLTSIKERAHEVVGPAP